MFTQNYNVVNNFSSSNVAIGTNALYTNNPTSQTNGIQNTAVGTNAGFYNTTGYANTFAGFESGLSNTTGLQNTYYGYYSGRTNTTGQRNTFIGPYAGNSNITGSFIVAIGGSAGYSTSTNGWCTFVGFEAGKSSTADYNTMFGFRAGDVTTTGATNTFVGKDAAGANTTGSSNVAVGANAGLTNTTGSNNTFVGKGADVCATCTSYTNVTAIGYQAVVPSGITGSADYFKAGNSSVQESWVQVDWTIGSDRRIKNNIQENVPGLTFIKLLKPVTFHYDIHKQNSMEGYPTLKDSAGNVIGIDTIFWQSKYDIEQKQFTGLIAQQVDSAAQQIGYDFSGVSKNGPVMGLRYSQFTIPLIKAVQELNDTLLKEKQNFDSLEKRVKQLEDIVSQCCAAPQKRMGNTTGDSGTENNAEKTIAVELKSERNIILYQNEPNPFSNTTTIRFFIPENSNLNSVFIVFYDEFGKEVKKVIVEGKGHGKIEALTMQLASGIYTYSLVIDEKVIDTKKMLRTK